jgi:hypothetical protein
MDSVTRFALTAAAGDERVERAEPRSTGAPTLRRACAGGGEARKE